jgi:hypothetical protein
MTGNKSKIRRIGLEEGADIRLTLNHPKGTHAQFSGHLGDVLHGGHIGPSHGTAKPIQTQFCCGKQLGI